MTRPNRIRKRPPPDAYDDLWRLLPAFLAFLAYLLVFATEAAAP